MVSVSVIPVQVLPKSGIKTGDIEKTLLYFSYNKSFAMMIQNHLETYFEKKNVTNMAPDKEHRGQ